MAEDGLTVGVEEEFLLVGPDGRLVRSGPEVVRATDDEPTGDVQEELARCQVESATGVCTDVAELHAQLRRLREELAAKAAARGLRLLPSGTPLLEESRPAGITPRPRYRKMADHFGDVATAAATCGCHVHLAIPDRATGIAISNHIRAWLPVLLTLTANSPYNYGGDTGYSSWRYVRWALWPSAGPPPMFESVDHYDDSVGAMLRAEAMLDRDMVYWDIRLSEKQPTLEIRVSDVAATAGEAALLALVVRGLVALALRDIENRRAAPLLHLEVLRAFLWRAARDGLGGRCPNPLTGELVSGDALPALLADHLRPVLHGEDRSFVLTGLDTLRRSGGGAQRQRAAFAARHRLTDVVDELTGNALLPENPEWTAETSTVPETNR
ncbi:carboxylate-amine ligase [Amycolatopsis marina]|nr:glutamate--cysteine ligase [Amycolatopsis marina]